MFTKRRLATLERVAWDMMSDEQRAASLKQKRDKREHLIKSINAKFAIVVDGPRAGQIVSVETGELVSSSRINALYRKDELGSVDTWLRDPRRREISSDELHDMLERPRSP
jgi:hypothetical protein